MYKIAKENGIENPRVIGWDFPNLSQEQVRISEPEVELE